MTPERLLADLRAELSSMLSPEDHPGDWSERHRTEYESRRLTLMGQIPYVTTQIAILADVAQPIATLTEWRTQLLTWRPALAQELLGVPASAGRGTADDQTQERIMVVKLAIRRIDRGLDEMPFVTARPDWERVGLGYDVLRLAEWKGSLPYVEQRLAELTARRDDAQSRLDTLCRDADAAPDASAPREAASVTVAT